MAVQVSFTGTLTSGSNSISAVNSTANLAIGQVLAGTGIPTGTTIAGIGSGTVTMSANATASASAEAIQATLVGKTLLTASLTQDSLGNLLTGTLEILPTDENDCVGIVNPTLGGPGGQLTSLTPAVVAVTAGALPANTWVPDTSVSTPQNQCFRFTFKDSSGNTVKTLTLVQPSGNLLDLDTYVANGTPLPMQVPGPQGLSDYQIAVANGFSGSQSAWLATLVGPTTPQQAASIALATQPVIRNLFDVTRSTASQMIAFGTGATVSYAGASLGCTGFMLVAGLSQIVANANTLYGDGSLGFAFYDETETYLSGVIGVAAGTPVTVPSGAIYCRVGFGSSSTTEGFAVDAATFIVVPGASLPSNYMAFGYTDPATASFNAAKDASAVTLAALPAVRNLFDLNRGVAGMLVDYTTGALASYPGESYGCTGFMVVAGLSQIIANENTAYSGLSLGFAFYDVNQNFISGVAGVAAGTAVSVPSNAIYCRVGFGDGGSEGFAANAATFMVVPGASLPSAYISFSADLPTVALTRVGQALLASRSVRTNLVDIYTFLTTGALISSAGSTPGLVDASINTWLTSPFIFCAGLTNLVGNQSPGGNSSYAFIAFYDLNKVFIASAASTYSAGATITAPSGAVYMRVSLPASMLPQLSVNAGTVSYPPQPAIGLCNAPPNRWLGKNYACVGDSITANGSAAAYGYQNALCAALGMNKVIDNGCAGHDMVDVLSYSGYTSVTNESTIQNIDLCTIFLGTNDFGNGSGTPLGDPLTSTDDTTFYGAIDLIINTFLGWKPTLKLVFFTPVQRSLTSASGFLGQNTPNAQGHVLLDYVTAILTKCGQYGIDVIDLFHTSGYNFINIGTVSSPIYSIDGELHPNQLGYQNCLNPRIIAGIASV